MYIYFSFWHYGFYILRWIKTGIIQLLLCTFLLLSNPDMDRRICVICIFSLRELCEGVQEETKKQVVGGLGAFLEVC